MDADDDARRARATSSTSRQEAEDAYAEHCREADIATAPLRDCLSYYNGHGEAEPGSLAYYGGGRWHNWRIEAQATLEPYVFDRVPTNSAVSRHDGVGQAQAVEAPGSDR